MLTILKRLWPSKAPDAKMVAPKPQHVAVIMDGNGRWANAQGLSRIAGHKQGVDSVKAVIKGCLRHKIPYLSIFAFSSENWNRPHSEVTALMNLLSNALETQTKKLDENGVRLQFVGDLGKFSERIQKLARDAEKQTSNNDKLALSVAINYGGRWDITQACQSLAAKVAAGEIQLSDIDEKQIGLHLSTAELPDPDLFIRTSGEYRISNFFLWQAAYSEFYFVDTLWPDFDEEAFDEALIKYTHRDRRFGNARDQVKNKKAFEDDASELAVKESQRGDPTSNTISNQSTSQRSDRA